MVDRYDHFPSSILHSQLKTPERTSFRGFALCFGFLILREHDIEQNRNKSLPVQYRNRQKSAEPPAAPVARMVLCWRPCRSRHRAQPTRWKGSAAVNASLVISWIPLMTMDENIITAAPPSTDCGMMDTSAAQLRAIRPHKIRKIAPVAQCTAVDNLGHGNQANVLAERGIRQYAEQRRKRRTDTVAGYAAGTAPCRLPHGPCRLP